MRSLLSSSLIVLALAGCSAASVPSSANSFSASGSRVVRPATSNGKFAASYTGTYEAYCVVHGHGSVCHYTLSGNGSGTFIGESTLSAKIACGVGRKWQGRFTLRSSSDRHDAITVSVPRITGGCGNRGDYEVKRGAGMFSGASGDGNASVSGLTQYGTSGSFSTSFNGRLTF